MEEAETDHDINLWNLILRCREVNLKLNPRKFQFKEKQVTWMGHLLSSKGITPHPDRVQVIKDMTPPQATSFPGLFPLNLGTRLHHKM